MNDELKRCPFCGGSPSVTLNKKVEYNSDVVEIDGAVECLSCGAAIHRIWYEDIDRVDNGNSLHTTILVNKLNETVFDAWNKRDGE